MPLYVKVIIYTACFLAIVGTCYYGYYYVDNNAYKRGVTETDKKWLEVQVKAKEDQVKAVRDLNEALRLQGMQLQTAVSALAESKIEGEKNVERGQDILLDAIYAGTYKLRIPTRPGSVNGTVDGGRGEETDSDSTESRCVAEGGSELHPALTAKLFGITGDADKLAERYNYLVDYTRLLLASCSAK